MEVKKRRRDRRGRGYWQKLVSRQEESGEKASEFCRSRDIGRASFYAWRRRLGSEENGETSTKDPGFVEVHRETGGEPARGICIRYGEFEIEVGSGFDAGVLRRVLDITRTLSRETAETGNS